LALTGFLLALVPALGTFAQDTGKQETGKDSRREKARQEREQEEFQDPRALLEKAREKPIRYWGQYGSVFREGDDLYLGMAGEVHIETEDFTVRARNVLLWLDPEKYDDFLGLSAEGDLRDLRKREEGEAEAPEEEEGRLLPLQAVVALYADEDVDFREGEHVIRADRLFYDLVEDKALFVDGYVKSFTWVRNKKLPLYLRAAEIRQISPRVFTAKDAFLSNCGFGTDVWHLSASELRVELPPESEGEPAAGAEEGDESASSAKFRAKNAVASAWGLPIFYLPSFSGIAGKGAGLYFKGARGGITSQFGPYLFTKWGDDIKVGSGKDRREVGDWTFHVDPSVKRGVGLGLDIDYKAPTGYGRIVSYYIHDLADEDQNGRQTDPVTGKTERIPIDNPDRGRFLLQYRHFLPWGIEGTGELSWLSDSNFLREYYEREYKQGKEQETDLYLKKVVGANAFTLLEKVRINDFLDQDEYLPEAQHRLMVQPLLPDGLFGTNLYYSSRNRIGNVRNRPSDEDPPPPEIDRTRITRFDTDHGLSVPVHLGPATLRPFTEARFSIFSDTREDEGTTNRFSAASGATLGTQFHRVFDVHNRFLRIDGLRHILNPLVSYVNRYADTVPSSDLIPIDDVESIDKIEFVRLQLRQRLQTHSGGGVYEFLNLDTAINIYPDEERDNGGRTWGNLELDLLYTPSRRLILSFESEWDWERDDFDVLNAGVTVRPSESFQARLGYNVAHDSYRSLTSQVFTRFNEKWSAFVFDRYDFKNRRNADIGVAIQRRTCQWIIETSISYDKGDDDLRLSLNITPALFYKSPTRRGGAWEREVYYDFDPFDPISKDLEEGIE